MCQKWYQSTAYDLPINRLVFFNNLLRGECLVNVASTGAGIYRTMKVEPLR
jgi:hypothetical protein